jgi:hypothetical protein
LSNAEWGGKAQQPAKSRLFSFPLDRSAAVATILVTFFSHPESIVSLIAQKFYSIGARLQAKKCRANGVSDGHIARVFEAVASVDRNLGNASDDDIRLTFFQSFESYAIDPATIMLIVQLCLLVYKALKAAGYFEQAEGFQSVANARSIIGEI